ncbi:SPOR domain-containing protein [Desulfobacter vibrioformis]|uniref:SPOR domain-containing protein n=1 Tax=Desulfobacter vibrioformis TaxID=34031 RepID=UPI00146FD771|nr:SPOR domain-containing protein [Desulfobacter vibrioformis]
MVTLFASIAGQQIGHLTYGMINPRPDRPAIQSSGWDKQAVKEQTSPGTTEKTVVSKVVKRTVLRNQNEAGAPTVNSGVLITDQSERTVSPAKVIEMAPNTKESTKIVYAVQTGVFSSKINAEENAERVKTYSPTTVILTCENGKKIYAVRIGSFAGKTEAEKALASFKKKEHIGAILVSLYGKHDLVKFCKK